MKKYILLIIILSCSVSLSLGNIMTPRAFISEVFVDSNDNWTIELGFYFEFKTEIDSIRIETTSGSSIVTHFTLIAAGEYTSFDSLSVINNSNLATAISIDPTNDYVKVISYTWGEVIVEYLAIGNYPGSFLDCADFTESLSYVVYQQNAGYTSSFCIDKSPTIGSGNDTTGSLSTFTGQLFDLDGELMSNVWFPMSQARNLTIHTDSVGSFNERIFARRYTFDTITIRIPPWPYIKEQYTIESVDFCIRPDTMHNLDIFTTGLIIGINEEIDQYENIVVVAPNPFTNKITFYFKFENLNASDELRLQIFSQNGRIIEEIALSKYRKKLDWLTNESIKSGIYFYQLIRNKQLIKNGKLIKL